MLSAEISLDRFVVLILKTAISEVDPLVIKANLSQMWKKGHLYFIVALLFVPAIFCHSLVMAFTFYEYLPGADNFRISATGVRVENS